MTAMDPLPLARCLAEGAAAATDRVADSPERVAHRPRDRESLLSTGLVGQPDAENGRRPRTSHGGTKSAAATLDATNLAATPEAVAPRTYRFCARLPPRDPRPAGLLPRVRDAALLRCTPRRRRLQWG